MNTKTESLHDNLIGEIRSLEYQLINTKEVILGILAVAFRVTMQNSIITSLTINETPISKKFFFIVEELSFFNDPEQDGEFCDYLFVEDIQQLIGERFERQIKIASILA